MSAVFADTSYSVAFVNPRDSWHELAMAAGDHLQETVVTTGFVLVEFGNALSQSRERHLFVELAEFMRQQPRFEIVAPSQELLERGVRLYAERPDKDWSLTDCISFVVMQERGLTDALTTDHHFAQAGFNVLMKR